MVCRSKTLSASSIVPESSSNAGITVKQRQENSELPRTMTARLRKRQNHNGAYSSGSHAEFAEKFAGRYFATPKKMGAQTAEANINAGIAAAKQIVGYFKDGCERFRVNK